MNFNPKRIFSRSKGIAVERMQKPDPILEHVRITNETVAARREEVLKSARKFIYPLDAPRHRIIKVSIAILSTAVIGFFVFCVVDLYRLQSTSSFMYGVTQVVPFPVAMIGNQQFVSYNDYLFELRHYMHYYETQQHADFSTKAGQQQLAVFRQRSLDQAIQNAYVQRLADENGVSVSGVDVDSAVALVRSQNRLGASDQVFQSVLNEFWGWSVDDFRRELRQELLAQKVVNKLDTQTHDRANQALARLQQGSDFAELAKEASDDQETRANGGDYGKLIDRANTDVAPQVMDALLKLQPGQYSGIINTGDKLVIVKVTQVQGTQLRASDIAFNFRPITDYTKPLQTSLKSRRFIHV